MSEVMKISCPACEQKYKFTQEQWERLSGKPVRCRRCGAQFSFPERPVEEPVPAMFDEEPDIRPPLAAPMPERAAIRPAEARNSLFVHEDDLSATEPAGEDDRMDQRRNGLLVEPGIVADEIDPFGDDDHFASRTRAGFTNGREENGDHDDGDVEGTGTEDEESKETQAIAEGVFAGDGLVQDSVAESDNAEPRAGDTAHSPVATDVGPFDYEAEPVAIRQVVSEAGAIEGGIASEGGNASEPAIAGHSTESGWARDPAEDAGHAQAEIPVATAIPKASQAAEISEDTGADDSGSYSLPGHVNEGNAAPPMRFAAQNVESEAAPMNLQTAAGAVIDQTVVQALRTAPDYPHIRGGARLLNGFAMVCWFMGTSAVAVAILFVVLACISVASPSQQADSTMTLILGKWGRSQYDWTQALWIFCFGFSAMVVAGLLQLLGSLALAMRDMARNSFVMSFRRPD